jgi:hypothetical protein
VGGLVLVVGWALLGACGNSPAPVTATVAPVPPGAPPPPVPEAPDGPVPSLRTATQPPIDHPDPLPARVQRRSIDGGLETLLVVLDLTDDHLETFSQGHILTVDIGGEPSPFAFAQESSDKSTSKPPLEVWARRPASAAGKTVEGDIFVPINRRGAYGGPGEHYRFRADDAAKANDPSLVADWERALEKRFSTGGWRFQTGQTGPWQLYARAKLAELAPVKPVKPELVKAAGKGRPAVVIRPTPPVHRSFEGLSDLMETTTGAIAVQEALQHDRTLFLAAAREAPSVPLSAVKGPALAQHPWGEMIKRQGHKPPAEPLAAAAPAEFYFARAASLPALFRLLDQVDQWGTPASRALDGNAEDRGLAARYEAELGVGRGPLSRALGPSVIADLAVVGSDPYVKEGSDVTLVFRVKDRSLFNAGIGVAMADHERAHGAITTKNVTMAGAAVAVSRSADGAVRQHRASAGDLEIVSNSPGAITRVLETIQGKHPRLSDERDFQYMLARDADTKADVLAYMGDRFVAEVVGPRQKIGEARRQIALSELMTPGFAALLYGVMNGKSPDKLADLFKAHLLVPAELTHATGGAISWKPGEPAVSAWGTPSALTPLIDLPQPDKVTLPERIGYERFARGYQSDWSQYIDPVAIRIAFERAGNGPGMRMTMDLRELPLLDRTRYREIGEWVGGARFDTSPIEEGARAVLGIGEDSELRRLIGQLRSLSGRHQLAFDWIGDWAMAGVLDRSQIAIATQALMESDLPQAPRPADERHHTRRADAIEQITKLPLYAAIAVKNPLGATLALTGLRAMAEESTPGLLDWGESGKYRDVSIVRVRINSKKAREEFGEEVDTQIFYAVTHGAILVAMNEATLRRLIDDRSDGKGPKAPSDAAGGEQVAIELGSDKGRGLWTALMWVFEGEVLRNDSGGSRSNAEALLYGAPERANDPAALRALAMAYFGGVPLGPDGGQFTLAKEGVLDPVRGTAYAPVWPALPIPGSPVDILMTAIAHARADLAFDDEGQIGKDPPMRSLHARAWVELREPGGVTP